MLLSVIDERITSNFSKEIGRFFSEHALVAGRNKQIQKKEAVSTDEIASFFL